MKEIQADIEIEASATVVWAILSDFASYPDWNPFMRSIRGELAFGERLTVKIQPPECRPWTFHPKILHVAQDREILWMGRLLLPGFFDGEHALLIEPVSVTHVRFSQRERFSGLLLAVLRTLPEKTQAGFEAMNRALKARAEEMACRQTA